MISAESQMGVIVDAWRKRISLAYAAREDFLTTAKICREFYKCRTSFMWNQDFQKLSNIKMADVETPMCVPKAFEWVATIGPQLYWESAKRWVLPREQFQPSPMLYGNQNDPRVQQQMQYDAQMSAMFNANIQGVADLGNMVLNFTPDNQPGGGLCPQTQMAIVDSMVTGRGVVLTERFQTSDGHEFPCSTFYPIDRLLVDPDSTDPTLRDARWIALECFGSADVLSKMYGRSVKDLRAAASGVSADTLSRAIGDAMSYPAYGRNSVWEHKRDVVRYYRVWSKMGFGFSNNEEPEEWQQALEYGAAQQMGDHIHMVITHAGYNQILNATTDEYAAAMNEILQTMPLPQYGDVPMPPPQPATILGQLFPWPDPMWRDELVPWPIAVLDHYRDNQTAWPISPMKAGLPWMIFINLLVSKIVEQVMFRSEPLIGCSSTIIEEFEKSIKKIHGYRMIEIPPELNKTIDEFVKEFRFDPTSADLWKLLELASSVYEKSMGMADMSYGVADTQSRSATDVAARQEALQIRPKEMGKNVAAFQSTISRHQWIVALSSLTPEAAARIGGPMAGRYWQQLVLGAPDISLLHANTSVTIEASGGRPRSIVRDSQNINALLNMRDLFQNYAQVTTDMTPINWLIGQWAKTAEMPNPPQFGPLQPPQPPPPTPEQQAQQEAQQQQQMQLQQAQVQAEVAKSQADVIKSQADAEKAKIEMQEARIELARSVAEMTYDSKKDAGDDRST